jgi:hypothetical protein
MRLSSGMQMPLHRIRVGVKIPASFDQVFLPIKILIVIALAANFSATVTLAAGTNYSALDVRYYLPGIIIGDADANKVRAAILPMGDKFNSEMKIMAVPASLQASGALPEFQPDPAFGAFLKPPGDAKFLRLELRDPDGKVLAPLHRQDGFLPPSLPVGIFPRYSRQVRHDGNIDFRDGLFRSPAELATFTIQDAYRIEKEGDYTLTVCCSIYILPYNGHPPANVDYDNYQTLSATRADLPCVTAKIHLAPP